jgi:hypothetical protein
VAGSPSGAWFVNFFHGLTSLSDISDTYYVRCVR